MIFQYPLEPFQAEDGDSVLHRNCVTINHCPVQELKKKNPSESQQQPLEPVSLKMEAVGPCRTSEHFTTPQCKNLQEGRNLFNNCRET